MPAHDALDMRLRRRPFIERTQAHWSRLRATLKPLGAVGPVVRPLPATRQQAIVNVHVTQASTTGGHIASLQRQQGQASPRPPLFGFAAGEVAAFVARAHQDPHPFRLVVTSPEQAGIDRTLFVTPCMHRVERDRHRPLDWLEAHHDDTDHPHTHVVRRGRDRQGKDLSMERDSFQYGLRARASQLLPWFLGPQRQAQQHQSFLQSDRQALDGIPRGLDDPEARGRLAQTSAAPGAVVDQQHQAQTGRSLGSDGPDDVRRHEALGPAPGSLEAVRIQLRFEDAVQRAEAQEEQFHPQDSLLARGQDLRQRAEALTQEGRSPTTARSQTQDQGRGM